MDVNIENKLSNIPDDEYSIDFETEKTAIRLGKSDRYFYMDLNDVNFPARLMQCRKDIQVFFEEKQKELNQTQQTEDMEVEDVEKIITLNTEIDTYIKSKINFIFGYDVCKDVFGEVSILSLTRKGEYYFDNFLNAILPLVEREFKIRLQASNERIKKYTDQKGLHPALKK